MEPNTKLRVLTWSLIVLILVNISLMVLLFQGRPSRHYRHERKRDKSEVSQFFIRKLEFTTEQKAQFDKLFDMHSARMKDLSDEMEASKLKLNEFLDDPENDSVRLLMENQTLTHRKIEEEIFRHMNEVYTVCDEQQREKLVQIFNQSFGKRHGKFRD